MGKNSDAKAAPKVNPAGLRIALIVSRFNSRITERLKKGALEALKSAGAKENQIELIEVPGAFEIPLVAKNLAESGRADALIAIGCVLRGETDHYAYVCSEVARGVQLAQLDSGVPIIFCVLTCETDEQAMERSGGKCGNKGFDAGLAAIEMAAFARANARGRNLTRAKGKQSKARRSSRSRR